MLGGAAGFVEGGGLRGSLGTSGRVYYAYANGEIAPGPRSSETLDQTAQELEREYDGDLSQRNLRSVVIGSGRFYAFGHRPVSPGASGGVRRGGRTANAPVLKTGVRKDMRVRIPPPPLYSTPSYGCHRITRTSSFSRVLPKLLPAPVNPSCFPASSK